ncbi:hypothetical protein GCM10018790_24570 [Kitasatospora xanthocidica]|uniref:type II toxin-antitoxin system Phd/YefM family antitoxin n=1 Tax=Kitasatospora xanthocidica TaxID=83382 RepID=UPI00199698FA|nr:type II toxin-antitoxin system prevent-host-death family antitoxin [Kitasatospora xanthocidica]GHF45819.1 hypothetical protein GCM10018790_24570 [Kitasatospora xanthocidica]
MTATEASRSFAAVLDSAGHGETIIVTRGGRRIAVIGPAPSGNGAALNDVLRRFLPDEDFAADEASLNCTSEWSCPASGRSRSVSPAEGPRGKSARPTSHAAIRPARVASGP